MNSPDGAAGRPRATHTVEPMTDTAPSPRVTLPGVTNLRDVGGQPTVDGRRVRTGVLYRSGQLDHADEHAARFFERCGLGVVFDLRTRAETAVEPDHLPAHVEVVHLDVLADEETSVAAHLADLFADPAAAETVLRSGDLHAHFLGTYRNLVLLDSARVAYRTLFHAIASSDDVALFHCTAGKDRTGWAAAALLSLLGVDDDVVTADYLLSSDPVVASFRPLIEQFAAAGGDPELLIPVFRVEPAFLNAARNEVHATFGSIEGYFSDGLGLGVDVQERLRERLLR